MTSMPAQREYSTGATGPSRSPETAEQRLIFALDVADSASALSLVHDLEGLVSFYKVGYQLLLAEGMPFVRELTNRGLRVFLDLKMDDVWRTISTSVEQIAQAGVRFVNIHGNASTAAAAREGRGNREYPKILSLTVLTSLDQEDLVELGLLQGPGNEARFERLEDLVLWRAEKALGARCDGLIAAGSDVAALRAKLGPEPIIVCPGIRPAGTAKDDQKRTATPRDAIAAGADYLVVGRPIRLAQDRKEMAKSIIADIADGLAAR